MQPTQKISRKVSETGIITLMINDIKFGANLEEFVQLGFEDYRAFITHDHHPSMLLRLHRVNEIPVITAYDDTDTPLVRKIMYQALFTDVDRARHRLDEARR